MPKNKESPGKNTSTTDYIVTALSVGEVAGNKDSSDSEDAPLKKVKKVVTDTEKGERPARKPKVRISQYVRGEAPPPPKFVMKLFDRSVDLAQFTLATPLYPICRAWFENDPHDSGKYDKIKEEEYKNLPKSQLYSGDGWYDPYIFPKGKPSADFTLEYDTLIPLPSKEELLSSNMAEWKAVRSHARNESNKRALKYKPTLETLRKINLNF